MTPPASIVHNCDCMTFMRTLPDKAFDLAICDPPYGIGEDGLKNHSRGCIAKSREYTPKDWDKSAPDKAVFDEIIRVSRNQIIFGANHFIDRIPYPSSCWIVWDKENGATDFADCELAWTSFPTAVRKFAFRWQGMLQGDMKHKEERIHPTQKPITLYAWILRNYAKEGATIYDPFVGSGSSRIAAYKLGFDFTGCEIDTEYHAAQEARFRAECFGEICINGRIIKQTSLFDFL